MECTFYYILPLYRFEMFTDQTWIDFLWFPVKRKLKNMTDLRFLIHCFRYTFNTWSPMSIVETHYSWCVITMRNLTSLSTTSPEILEVITDMRARSLCWTSDIPCTFFFSEIQSILLSFLHSSFWIFFLNQYLEKNLHCVSLSSWCLNNVHILHYFPSPIEPWLFHILVWGLKKVGRE